jgi:hypothetical protein
MAVVKHFQLFHDYFDCDDAVVDGVAAVNDVVRFVRNRIETHCDDAQYLKMDMATIP